MLKIDFWRKPNRRGGYYPPVYIRTGLHLIRLFDNKLSKSHLPLKGKALQKGGETKVDKKESRKSIANNKKAFHDYFVDDKYEAGIELFGTEVKSIRAGQVNLKDSWCDIKNGEIFVQGMHISPYEKGNIFNRDPLRVRRLLMHKREIMKLNAAIQQQGMTLVPLELYFSGSRVKVSVGLCRGKKLYDKRDDAAKRDMQRDIERHMKEQRR